MTGFDPFENPRQREEREAQTAEAQQRQDGEAAEDIKWMVAHRAGRRTLWRLLARCGVFRTPFHTSGSLMSFRAGEQNIGQELLAQIMEHAPDAFPRMMAEAADEARRAAKQQEG